MLGSPVAERLGGGDAASTGEVAINTVNPNCPYPSIDHFARRFDHPGRRIGDHCCSLDVRSSDGVQANRVRLSLFVLAYNLGNFLRRLCLPKAVKHWSLRSVQVKLIKMGGRLVRHSRRLIFQLSEV